MLKKLLLFLFFLSFAITANAALISHWRMDEPIWAGTTPGAVLDVTGTNSGTAYGGATTVVGHEQRAGYFDGSNDYVQVADSSSLSFPSGGMSASAWVKLTTAPPPAAKAILGKYENPFEYVVGIGTTGNIGVYLYDNSAGTYLGRQATNLMTDTNWHHITFTYTGGTVNTDISIYLDGVKVDNSNTGSGVFWALENTSSPFVIGSAGGWGSASRFNGSIDEVRIYNYALTQAEVTQAYWEGNHTRLRNATLKNCTIK